MHHHRRVRRLVVEARVAALSPCEKAAIHFLPQRGDPRAGLRPRPGTHLRRPRRRVRLQPQNVQLRPPVGECRPFVVPCIGAGDRFADRLHQACKAARPVGLGVDSDPRRRPSAAKGLSRLVGHGGQHPLEEQVVDVDANVVVVEGEVRWPFECESCRSARIPRAGARGGVSREAVEKAGPAFLQEREEGASIRHDGFEGPGVECPATPEQVNQAFIQDARQPLAPWCLRNRARSRSTGRLMSAGAMSKTCSSAKSFVASSPRRSPVPCRIRARWRVPRWPWSSDATTG